MHWKRWSFGSHFTALFWCGHESANTYRWPCERATISCAVRSTFTLSAAAGREHYTISENAYLAENASTLSYSVDITVNGDGTWSYNDTTMLKIIELPDPFAHTDHNTLHKVG